MHHVARRQQEFAELAGVEVAVAVEVLWNENIPHVKSKLKWADIFGDYHPWFTVKSFAGDYKPPPKPPAKKALTDDVGAATATTPEGTSQLLQTMLAEEQDRAQVQTEAMEELKERDAYVAEKGVEAARVPDAVANRMIMRMATFGGVPVFLGIGVFVWFYFQATNEDNVFQPTAVAAATTVPWVLGLLGIGFGALSASWDEEDEGSALGVDEIKLNVGRLVDGVQRSAKDELMREKMDKE